jgi:hypothetical protein
MRVELLTVYSTLRRAYRIGETINLPDADAIRLIDRELAKPVRGIQTEMAVVSQGEHAIQRGGRSIPQSKKDKRQ